MLRRLQRIRKKVSPIFSDSDFSTEHLGIYIMINSLKSYGLLLRHICPYTMNSVSYFYVDLMLVHVCGHIDVAHHCGNIDVTHHYGYIDVSYLCGYINVISQLWIH